MHSKITRIINLRQKEKEIITEIITLLEEINQERLYVTCNTNSLFKFCTKVLCYTEMEATLRINAMKVSIKMPEIKNDIEKGDLTLTSASLLHNFLAKNPEFNPTEVKEKIINKSTAETKFIFDKMKNPEMEENLKITLPAHIAKKISKIAGENNLDVVDTIEFLADSYNRKNIVIDKPKASNSINQRYISKKAREFVLHKANYQCEAQYNNKRCTSKTNLNLDHQRPINQGGNSEVENLRVLCFHCNQRAHIKNIEAPFQYSKVTL